MKRISILALVLTLGFMSACGSKPTTAAKFTGLASRNLYADISQLQSPKEAVAESAVIVRGRLRAVEDGTQIESDDQAISPRMNFNYALFVVSVSEVISGDKNLILDNKVYFNVLIGDASPGSLDRANPEADTVAILYRLSAEPVPGATYTRPKGLPSEAALLGGYLDGVWLQTSSDPHMFGLQGSPEILPEAWGSPSSVDEYAQAIRKFA